MKLIIDRFTIVALCITAVTGIAINKLDIVQAVISYMF